MWVEIVFGMPKNSPRISSSSSWGCELKCICHRNRHKTWSHPLREDVSWNNSAELCRRRKWRSSSSWGCELKYYSRTYKITIIIVILFVRMWVEMLSAAALAEFAAGHPLRENVSWNANLLESITSAMAVILFVKMWVEILKSTVLIIVVAIWFFLWGGELKYPW